MKLALVVHDFDPGYGQGRYCVEIARRLAGRIEVEVHSNTWNTDPIPGTVWRKVPAWRRNVVTTVASFLPLAARSLRHFPATLVHAQGLSCWSANVITAHICNAARRHHLAGLPIPARAFASGISPVERSFYRRQKNAHLIAVSEVVRREIQTHYGWNGASSVIYHGTDISRFRPSLSNAERSDARQRYGVPADAWVWLFAGEAVKGLREIIRILPRFPAAHLLAITRSVRDEYQALAESLGVDGRTHLRGPESKLELAYRSADVFVYPAHYDSFALVAAEAMASGVPVVLGNQIGAAELIAAGENGLLCDPRDPDSIQRQLRWIQDHPDRAGAMGQSARKTIERHTWDDCIAATWAVYQQMDRSLASKKVE